MYMFTCLDAYMCTHTYMLIYIRAYTHTFFFFFSTAVLKSWSLTSASPLLICNRQNQSCSPWSLEAAESSIPSAPSPQSLENPLGTYLNWISGQSIAMNLLLALVPMQTHLQEAVNSVLKTLHPTGPWELAEQNEHHMQKKIPTLGPQIGPQLQVPVVAPSQPWDKEWGCVRLLTQVGPAGMRESTRSEVGVEGGQGRVACSAFWVPGLADTAFSPSVESPGFHSTPCQCSELGVNSYQLGCAVQVSTTAWVLPFLRQDLSAP